MRETNNRSGVRSQKSEVWRGLGSYSEASGFTLIEVIVSITILSISFVMIMQLFASGLKSARLSCDYTRAVLLAKDKMEEMSESPRNDSGDYEDGFRWETEAESYKEQEGTDANLMKIKVKIMWDYMMKTQKTLEIVSLKAVFDEDSL